MARGLSRRSSKSRRRSRTRRGGNILVKSLPVLTLLGLNQIMGKKKKGGRKSRKRRKKSRKKSRKRRKRKQRN